MPAAMTVPANEHIDDTVTEPIPASAHALEGDFEIPMSPPARAALAVAERLETLLREEIRTLRGASIDTLKQMNHRKSQCLLEFSRAARSLGDEPAPPALAARLDRLKGVVADNQATLSTHIVAVRDIAGLIAEAMQAHESDGTYADRPATRAPLGGETGSDNATRRGAAQKGKTP